MTTTSAPNPTNNYKWQQVPGKLKQISVGSASQIWGVNKNDEIFQYVNNQWQKISGGLKHVSVAADGTVWGVNAGDLIHQYLGNNQWKQISGGLKQISVGSASQIWGVNKNDEIFRYVNNQWEKISGGLKYVSVAADGTVWGVNANDDIFRLEEPKVAIFAASNFGGASQELGVGSYDLKDLSIGGDALSSLKVPAGYKVTLYENSGFQGKSKTLTSDAGWVGDDFNDKTSSIRIEKIQDSLPTVGKDYYIVAKHTGKGLAVNGESQNNGANIVQWDIAAKDHQKFQLQDAGNGYYYIVAKHSGKSIAVNAESQNNGADIVQWDIGPKDHQKWKFQAV